MITIQLTYSASKHDGDYLSVAIPSDDAEP